MSFSVYVLIIKDFLNVLILSEEQKRHPYKRIDAPETAVLRRRASLKPVLVYTHVLRCKQ